MKITFNRIIFLFLLLLASSCSEQEDQKEEPVSTETKRTLDFDTTGYSLKKLDNLYERKTLKPRDRDLIEYLTSNPNRPDSTRKVIYLLPLGHMHSGIEEIILEDTSYYKSFFQLEVKVLPRVAFDDLKKLEQIKTRELPIRNSSGKKGELESEVVQEQIEAKSLIDHYIIPNKPKDAVAILGITDHDIYSKKYNFLYGSSNTQNGAGLISTHRIKSYRELTQSNIRKVATKQITNLFSIKNVKDYNCLLNFHNGMNELRNGLYYISPRALEKLKINIGFDYDQRFRELVDFWKKEENPYLVNHYYKCLGVDSTYTVNMEE